MLTSRLNALFQQLSDAEPTERARLLSAIERDDPALHRELLDLLEHAQTQADPVARAIDLGVRAPGWIPDRIGPWLPIRLLGSGGMGEVWLAEHVELGSKHRAALKLLRGAPSRALTERFQREQATLASLEHPNIAHLLDAGSGANGLPYLAMSYVEGRPLDAWLESSTPDLNTRLRLFATLCRAVHHAHSRLIVHRDLKPSNIMVRDDGTPVLLDFGIAKLLQDTSGEHTRAFTPDYAAPEQLRGEAVSTATDIYALGLLLHELLTGRPRARLDAKQTQRPPSRLAAEAGATHIRAEARRIRGDLDRMVEWALRDEPQRRYPSALALAEDIDAFLGGYPVRAQPSRLGYVTGKFVRRHRWAVIVAVLAVALLGLQFVQVLRERARAQAAEQQALQRAEQATQLADFLRRLFESADPDSGATHDISARELLDRGRIRLERERLDRNTRARLMAVLGQVYESIGVYPTALELLDLAIPTLRHPGMEADLIDALHARTLILSVSGDGAGAYANADEARQVLARLPDAPIRQRIGVESILGIAEMERERPEAAGAHFAQALLWAQRAKERESELRMLHNLGWQRRRIGQLEESERYFRASLDGKLQDLGEQHPSTLRTMQMLSQLLVDLGRLEEAEATVERLVRAREQTVGPDSQDTLQALIELASVRQDRGDYLGAAETYTVLIERLERVAPDTIQMSSAYNNFGTLVLAREDPRAAIEWFGRARAIRDRLLEPSSSVRARASFNLARAMLEADRYPEARTLLDVACAARDQIYAEANHPERLDCLLQFGRLDLRQRGAHAEALAQGLTVLLALPGDSTASRQRRAVAYGLLAEAAARRGDRQQAAQWYGAEYGFYVAAWGSEHPLSAQAALRWAIALDRLGMRARAKELVTDAQPILRAELGAEAPSTRLAGELLRTAGRVAAP